MWNAIVTQDGALELHIHIHISAYTKPINLKGRFTILLAYSAFTYLSWYQSTQTDLMNRIYLLQNKTAYLTCNALRGAHRSGRSGGEVVAVVVRRVDLSIKKYMEHD